jgi:hypothetical protein
MKFTSAAECTLLAEQTTKQAMVEFLRLWVNDSSIIFGMWGIMSTQFNTANITITFQTSHRDGFSWWTLLNPLL